MTGNSEAVEIPPFVCRQVMPNDWHLCKGELIYVLLMFFRSVCVTCDFMHGAVYNVCVASITHATCICASSP